MKIILCRKSRIGAKLRRYVLPAILGMLFVSVAVSQVFIGMEKNQSKEAAVPAGTMLSEGTVELSVVGNAPPDSAWVWVNGEQVATFVDGRAVIDTGDRCVIEVMNESGSLLDVYISAKSANVETVGDEEAVKCSKGLTYICRCYCT